MLDVSFPECLTAAMASPSELLQKLLDLIVWDNLSSLSFRCMLVSNFVFWISSFLGLWVDHLVLTQQSQWLKSCKVQPNVVISGRDRTDLIKLAFFNMVVVAGFVCCPIYEWLWIKLQPHRLGEHDDDWTLIWKHEVLVKLPIHALATETAFYVFHGFLHWSPFFYKNVHRVHHRFPAPTAMACVYAHPFEFAIGNVLPIYLGPMLVTNAHPITCYIWWALAMLGTCKGHSGYRIMGHSDDHEEHHLLFKYNYGGMCLLDRLLGTTPPKTQPTQAPNPSKSASPNY